MNWRITRRALLERGLHLSAGVAVAATLSACGGGSKTTGATQACADPSKLGPTELSTRKAVGYVEQSSNPQSVCAGCAFFHAPASGEACGKCDMFNGGPVNPGGYCRSWTARAATPNTAAG
ncbi:high-potential iron-sulfur protein [Peristeroidobacter soli]|uniref:high-potential iron-sulfur protein n=1 Tax=Peristeroidobacter soli TaxID=2497877 RepID=UPI00101C26DD